MNQDLLDKFISYVSKDKKKSISFLIRNMSLTDEQAEDIFQDSCVAFYENLNGGKLENLSCTISTYLNEICKRQALKYKRDHSEKDILQDESEPRTRFVYIDEKLDEILDLTEEDNSGREEKNKKVQEIVRELPKPCDEIFWGMYRDGLSLKEIGEILGYASYEVVKKTRQRCMDKFEKKFKY